MPVSSLSTFISYFDISSLQYSSNILLDIYVHENHYQQLMKQIDPSEIPNCCNFYILKEPRHIYHSFSSIFGFLYLLDNEIHFYVYNQWYKRLFKHPFFKEQYHDILRKVQFPRFAYSF